MSAISQKRKDFKHEKEVKDPVTGETIRVFPATTRLGRQFLQVPFALLASLALGTLIATCFGIEIFLSEVYNGPLKTVLVCWNMYFLRVETELKPGIPSDRSSYYAGSDIYDPPYQRG